MELDLDPTVLVGPDFLAGLADDDGGLGALDLGNGYIARWAVGCLGAQGGKAALEDGTGTDLVGGTEDIGLQLMVLVNI